MGRRKQSSDDARNSLDAFVAVAANVQQQEKHQRQQGLGQGWDGQLRDDEQQQQSSSASVDRREDSDLHLDESLSAWDENHSDRHHQQHNQPFSSLLFDTLSSGLPATPRFDPLTSSFDDMDFSAMEDDGHFDMVDQTTLSLASSRHAHAQATAAPSPQTTAPHPEPPQHRQHRSHQHQQTPATSMFGTPSTTTTPSYQTSSAGLSQTTPLSISTAASVAAGGGMRYWTTQLAELSRGQPRSPVPLDVMLQQSSQLLPRVTEALRSIHSSAAAGDNTSASSASVLILILVCLTQVVALVEQVIPSVLDGHSSCSTGDGGSTANLSLRLGAFQIDREDQQALQMHLVSKELSSMLQVSNLIRQTLLQPEWRCVSKRTHNLLLEDLQARTKTLVYQMKQKRGTTARVLVL